MKNIQTLRIYSQFRGRTFVQYQHYHAEREESVFSEWFSLGEVPWEK